MNFSELMPSCELSEGAIYGRIRRFVIHFYNSSRWLEREGISNRRVTHVAQKPQFSEDEAIKFLNGFRTCILAFANRNVVNIDEVSFQDFSQ